MYKVCSLLLLAVCGSGFFETNYAAETGTEQTTQAVATTMSKRANVRFGPSLQAKVIVTLDANAPVEVLGVAQGMPEWYVIRFPREGSAWVHEKVLQAQEDGKTYVVTEDRARVRDDSRLGGNIVAELALGEIVEAKDRKRVGAWLPVYPPSAVAYVHKSVLNVPQEIEKGVEKVIENNNQFDDLWEEVQARYAAYKGALDRDVEIAAKLDWEYLSKQLGQVVANHPSIRIQLAAKRLQDRIAPVVTAALQVQRQHDIIPSRDVPGQPTIAKVDPQNPVNPPQDPTPPKDPNVKPVDTDKIKDAATDVPPAPASEFAAQGFLEERGVASVGTNHVIIDKNGKICAFVKAKEGVDLQLSEFFWRMVGVKGSSTMIEPDKHGQGTAPIPLVTVEDVMLLSR